jgi:hypothetical protein
VVERDTRADSFRWSFLVGGVIIQLIIMVAYTLVLLAFVWRWTNDKPVKKQIELFSWWPQALRTKSYKRTPANSSTTTMSEDSTRTNSDVGVLSGQTTRVGSDGSTTVNEKVGGFGNTTGSGGAATDKEVRGAKKLLAACLGATLLIFIRYVRRSFVHDRFSIDRPRPFFDRSLNPSPTAFSVPPL